MKLRKKKIVDFKNADSLYDVDELKKVMNALLAEFHFTNLQEADRALWVYGNKLAGNW